MGVPEYSMDTRPWILIPQPEDPQIQRIIEYTGVSRTEAVSLLQDHQGNLDQVLRRASAAAKRLAKARKVIDILQEAAMYPLN